MTSSATTTDAISVLDHPDDVATILPPIRREILASLASPDSATSLSKRLGLARQKVNYHVRELERAGLVACVDEVARRGCTERIFRATARAIVINPAFLGSLGADADSVQDRFSSAYMLAAASRTIGDVSLLRERARAAAKKLTTVSIESEIAFASPADLSAFSSELAERVAELIARHAQPNAPAARKYRLNVALYPTVTKSEKDAAAEAAQARPNAPTPTKRKRDDG